MLISVTDYPISTQLNGWLPSVAIQRHKARQGPEKKYFTYLPIMSIFCDSVPKPVYMCVSMCDLRELLFAAA